MLRFFFIIFFYTKKIHISDNVNILDVLNINNLRKFNIIYNANKIDYNQENRDIRKYIWYNIIKNFSHKLQKIDIKDFLQLKMFMSDKSEMFNVLLDKHGKILKIPIEIKRLIINNN